MPMTRTNQIRLGFLLAFLPLAALASALIRSVPVGMKGGGSFAMDLDESREHAFLKRTQYVSTVPRVVRSSELSVNLDDGTLTRTERSDDGRFWVQVKDADVQFSWTNLPPVETESESANPKWANAAVPIHRIQHARKNTQTGQIQTRAIELPATQWTSCSGRFLVSLDFNRAVTLDMTDLESRPIETKLPHAVMDYVWLPQNESLLLIEAPATPAPAFDLDTTSLTATPDPSLPPPSTLALFSINETSGELQAQHRFQVATISANQWASPWITIAASETGDRVPLFAHVSIGGDAIVVRSLADGSVIETHALPGEVDLKTASIEISHQNRITLKGPGASKSLDLRSRQWRDAPVADARWATESPDSTRSIWIAADDWDHAWVVDEVTHDVISDFEIVMGDQLKFRDRDWIVQLSTRDALSVTMRDAGTGQIVRQFKPLSWARYALAAMLVGYLLWSLAFLSSSVMGNPWSRPWYVMGVALVALTMRAMDGGTPIDPQRLVFTYAQGMSTALATQVALGLVLAHANWKRFLLGGGGFVAFLIALLAFVFRGTPETAWVGLATTLVPACLTLILWGGMRLLGWRIAHCNSISHPEKSATSQPISIRDGLILTVLFALLFGAARPILSGIHVLPQIIYAWQTIGVGLGVALATACCLLGRSRWLAGAVLAIGILIASAVMAECVVRFSLGMYHAAWFDGMLNLRGTLVFTAAVILVWWPLRWDDWRLQRGLA